MMPLSCCWVSVALFSLITPYFALNLNRNSLIRRFLEHPSDPNQDKWFLQILDHSDPTSSTTWEQRYQVDPSWFDRSNDGPVFLYISGEAVMGGMWGAWLDYAQYFNALCFSLEHRFYGFSQPTGDLSVSSLRYLSSEQALADIASFINGMNKEYNLTNNNRWVLFGGSYAGNLVAWARLKYPHLVHAVVSSSGPVLAQMNFRGYDRVVRESLDAYGKGCTSDTHQAFLDLAAALKKPDASEVISKKFNLCSQCNLTSKWDVSNMFSDLTSHFDAQDSSEFIIDACHTMTDSSEDLISRLATLNLQPAARNSDNCFDVSFKDELQYFTNTNPAHYYIGVGYRSWLYQTCTEFGYFQTSVSSDDLFGPTIPLELYIENCKDVFGQEFDERRVAAAVKRTNHVYGGQDIVNHVTNVVFVQGSLDPWHVLGVSKSSNPDAPAILIEGTRHCANMFPQSSYDPPQLVAARKQIVHYLDRFLSK